MAGKIFSLYRYQILPMQKQYNLLYDLNDILKRKNIIFEEALLNLKISVKNKEKRRYRYDMIRHGNNSFLLVVSREKSVKFYREDYVKDYIPSFPPVHIIIDNNPDEQILAVENSSEYKTPNTLVKIFERSLQGELEKNNLFVKFSPIYKESSFWNYIEKYKDDISSLHFTLITPNMSNISGGLCEDLKNIAHDTRASITDYKIEAEKGATLHIDKSNEAIAGLADYTAKGGGDTTIKRRNSKISYKSNDYQFDIEIDELELKEDVSKLIEKIRSKTHGPNR